MTSKQPIRSFFDNDTLATSILEFVDGLPCSGSEKVDALQRASNVASMYSGRIIMAEAPSLEETMASLAVSLTGKGQSLG